jgi:hypothetical protein
MRSQGHGGRRTLRYLWLLCVLMPVACVGVAGCLFWIGTDRAFVIPQLTDVWMMHSAIVAAPFVFLAARASSAAKQLTASELRRSFVGASVVGVLVTLVVWGVYYHDGYTYWAERRTSGANIGLGCFMLLSPIVVVIAMLVGRGLFGRAERENGHTLEPR